MFKHPLRIKNQSIVKKSERKALFAQISTSFPAFSTSDIQNDLFSEGGDIRTLKVEVSVPFSAGPAKKDSVSPTVFTVYCDAKKQPLFVTFDLPVPGSAKPVFHSVILPTVYALWICPKLFPLNFFTVPEVILKLQGGADLMLAGVTVSEETKDFLEKGAENSLCLTHGTVAVLGSDFPIAVGSLVMDAKDLTTRLKPGGELKGRFMKICHIIGDELWALGDKSQPPSNIPTPISTLLPMNQLGIGDESHHVSEPGVPGKDIQLEPAGSNSEDTSEDSMDALFRRVVLVTLKSKAADGNILASTLSGYMTAVAKRLLLPTLDVKRASYKKFSKLLDSLADEGLLTVSSVKGVQTVTNINWKHLSFAGVEPVPDEPSSSRSSLKVPSAVRQVYVVNGRTAPLFSAVNPEIKKGSVFLSTDGIRETVSAYVRTKALASKVDSSVVNLDALLMDLVLNNKGVKFQGEWPMKWGELLDKTIKEVTTNHEIVFTNGQSIELKGKLVPIDVKVEKKSGNKLLSVIQNLEGLGMDPVDVAREIQQVVGAGVNVREDGSGQNLSRSVTVQGDQTKLLHKFFFETLSIPKKFVTGLDKPGKKG